MARQKPPPPRQLTDEVNLPAPVGGMNTVDPGRRLPETDCIYAWNMVASDLGLVSRTGWREWATGLTGSSDNTVRTVMSFHASTPGSDKLFVATSSGIWDVTASTTAPSLSLAFSTASGNAGWGVAQAVVASGGHFLLYADEVNGLHYYSETTGVWAAYTSGTGTGQVSGVDPAAVVNVTVWKNRVWLTQRGSASAWYLAIGAVFGAGTEFSFGQRFAHGGYLIGLYNWSTDGGSGLDTLLVAIGAGGDVVIYVGTDPSSASTFGLKGVWFVGAVPSGRSIATDLGGDLLIISALGVMPLSKLVIGNPVVDRTQYATNKISNLFSRLVAGARNFYGWALHVHPTDNALLVLIPQGPSENTQQLAMSTSTRGWTRYRDLPMMSAAVWGGELYFGTEDGRVCLNSGDVDAALLADGGNSAVAVNYSVLFPFHGDARNKQVQMVRPVLTSGEAHPSYSATARYGFDQSEPDAPSEVTVGESGSWDYGVVEGTLKSDTPVDSTTVEVIRTSTADFPAESSSFRIGAGGASDEVVSYDTWNGTTFSCPDTQPSLDHFAGETVRLYGEPDDDTGTWDVALWGGADLGSGKLRGASGMGKDFAIAIRGAARSRTTLIAVDVLFTRGGFL